MYSRSHTQLTAQDDEISSLGNTRGVIVSVWLQK